MNYFSTSFRLFVCLVLKIYLKISRNHAVAVARAYETKLLQKKYSFETERKETFYCNKMNNRRRVRAFTKKEQENFSDVIGITDWRNT